MIITACISCLTTGGPGKKHNTDKLLPKPTRRIREWPKWGRRCQPIIYPANFPEILTLESALTEIHAPPGRALSRQTKYRHEQDWSETTWKANPTSIKPETSSHEAQQFWAPLPCCSLLEHPFSIKSFALSVFVSPRTIHFQVLDKSPLSGPGRGPPQPL